MKKSVSLSVQVTENIYTAFAGGKTVMLYLLFIMFCIPISADIARGAEDASDSCTKNSRSDYRNMPGDYVYRNPDICPPGDENDSSLWPSFFGLSGSDDQRVAAEEANELKMRVRELCAQLLKNSAESIAEEYVVTVNSFVNLNNLYKVSGFGRYVGEQLIGELQLAGVEVIDVRKTPGIMIHRGMGEYGLSRDMEELTYVHSAHAAIVGTYTISNNQILVNARLLANKDGMVLSQANLVFELDPLTKGLLADESMPPRTGSLITVEPFKK